MTWLQNYNPLGNAFLSTLVAALPIVVLLVSIALLGIRIHFAALLATPNPLAALMGVLVFCQAYVPPFAAMVVR